MKTTPIELPSRFGSYYLFDHIGTGGMAEIFLAKTFTELGTERLCVIKRILSFLNEDKEFCEMLINEAKLCANLSHANVVQTYELGQIDNQYYIAMEYVEGVDLNRLLGLLSRARISLPLQFALYIIAETLKGLDYAHRLLGPDGQPLSIIHRDVSPTNVLISTEGEIKLCDFGIAKVAQDELDSNIHHVDEHHIKGKVAYMAPEHVAGKPIDKRADLFAAGILLWELLCGRRLYKTKDDDETLKRASRAEIPPVLDRGFPEFEMLSAIVNRALAKSPEDRFQNGQEFIRAIEDYMHVTGQIVSQLRFSNFLMENFGDGLRTQRRERERNLMALMIYMEEQNMYVLPGEKEASGEGESYDDRFTMSLLTGFEEEEDVVEDDSEPQMDLDENLAAKFEQEEISENVNIEPAAAPSQEEVSRAGLSPWIWIGIPLLIAAAAVITGYFLNIF